MEAAGFAATASGLPWNNAIVYLLELWVVCFGMCEGRALKKAFLVLAYDAVGVAVEVACVNATILLGICDLDTMLENEMISGVVALLVQMFLLVLIQLAAVVWKKYAGGEIDAGNWAGLFGMCGCCFTATVLVGTDMIQQSLFSIWHIVIFVILIALNFLSYYFYTVSAERARIAVEAKVYENQIDMYQEWYESIQTSRKELRAFRHDMRNHMNALHSLCGGKGQDAEECLGEIAKYIEHVNGDYLEAAGEVDSGNPMLDAVVGAKKSYAASRGIEMEVKLQVPAGMKINGVDLVILLGNLLDNGIEACDKIPPEAARKIVLRIEYQMGAIFISAENTYDGRLDGRSSKEGLLIKTDKKNEAIHGIGMKNMLKIIEKYNGAMEWKGEQGVFTTEMMLYHFDQK